MQKIVLESSGKSVGIFDEYLDAKDFVDENYGSAEWDALGSCFVTTVVHPTEATFIDLTIRPVKYFSSNRGANTNN